MIRALFFGPVAERAGVRESAVVWRAGLRWQDVQAELAARFPEAFRLVSLVAVNGAAVAPGEAAAPLADGAEIVFMSPFSGG
jgi:molybdopterin converting factor small subunit